MHNHLANFAKLRGRLVARLYFYQKIIAAKLRAAGAGLRLSVRNHTRNTVRVLRDRGRLLLWRPRFVYLAIAAVGLPVLASFLWPDEDAIRRAGLVLQVLGICTVAWGIRKTRKLFKQESFWNQAHQGFRQWLRDWKHRRDGVVGMGAGSLSVSGGRARLRVWSNVGPDASPEQRIEGLEKNLTRVRDDLARFEEKTDAEIAKLDQALKEEQQSRARADQKHRDLLTLTETGGLHISMAGVVLLSLGVTISTMPSELAENLFQPVHCLVSKTSPRCG